jgi:bifunctional non-homologous end joining protein LigD
MLRKVPFIAPMAPTLAKQPPMGPNWLHEVKFDGFRAQVHIGGGDVAVYSRAGNDMMRRFRSLRSKLASIPIDSAIIDAELVACDESGQPDFRALMNHRYAASDLFLCCFDLLALDGEPLTEKPLSERRHRLNKLLKEADERALGFSVAFEDPGKLLATAEKMGLEGIVSKRKDSAYRSGPTRDWVNVKTAAWREANRDRHEMLEKKP